MSKLERKYFIGRLYSSLYKRNSKGKNKAKMTVHFTVNGESLLVAENESIKFISELRMMAEFHKPEKITAVIDFEDENKVLEQEFGLNPDEILARSRNIPAADKNTDQAKQIINGFTGFGQVGIEEYINKKLEEDRKERKLTELETELNRKKEEVTSLKETIQKLEDEISDNEDENEELLGELERKKSIRYYAGLTGDILDSIGLKKEMLKKPLAGLIDSEYQEGNKQLAEQTHSDESGIVEDNPKQDKRTELISLISDYLATVDNQTLANIFSIFSEIEQNNNLAAVLVQQLSNQKQKEDANF